MIPLPTEPNVVLAVGMACPHPDSRAAAASPLSIVGPPSMVAGGDTGGTREPLPPGKSAVAPGLPVLPPLTDEQVERVACWIEIYAIRPVGIPAEHAPVESWEIRIVREFRAWGAIRKSQREAEHG